MSAYLVHENHIRVLAEALYVYEVPESEPYAPSAIGQMLWDENAASVAYRYREDAEVLDYTHILTDWMHALVGEPWAVLVLCLGYQYQACEHPAWETSGAYRRIHALETLLLARLGYASVAEARKRPEWDKAPWSIGEDPYVMAKPIVTPLLPRKTRYISTTETASLIRAALKTAFPGVKFSVRSKKYSGGSSIQVDWIDGPTVDEAKRIYGRFEGASFDGMVDLKSYHDTEVDGELVHYGADYVFGDRSYSPDFFRDIAAKVAAQHNAPVPEIKSGEYSGAYIDSDYTQCYDTRETGREPLSVLVHRAACQVSAIPKPRVRIPAIARPCAST